MRTEPEVLSRTARELAIGGGVRLWLARLDVHEMHDELCAVLSEDEIARAAAYPGASRGRRFSRARGILRMILGQLTDSSPAELRFVYGRDGKPALAPQFAGADLHFNVSHARDVALIATAHGRRVGVDLTWVEGEMRLGTVAARFFSVPERAAYDAASEGDRRAVFSRIWVRKEAYLKGRGEGISERIYETDLSDVVAGQAAAPSTSARRDQDHWHFFDVAGLPAGYLASVALERLTT